MAIADLAATARDTSAPPWRTCHVCHALSTIPEAEADALRELLAGTLRYGDIAAALEDDPDTPLSIEPSQLSRHARGRCSAREKLRGQ